MTDHPVSAISAGLGSGAGAAVAFVLGVVGGTVLALFITLEDLGFWYMYPLAAAFLVLWALLKLWGLLLIPVYAIAFYGLAHGEWNRLRSAVVLAFATCGVLLLTLEVDLGDPGTRSRLAVTGGVLGLLCLASFLWEQRWRLSRR